MHGNFPCGRVDSIVTHNLWAQHGMGVTPSWLDPAEVTESPRQCGSYLLGTSCSPAWHCLLWHLYSLFEHLQRTGGTLEDSS